MKICLAKNKAPFIHGGAELLTESLAHALERHGHQVEALEIPFAWDTPQDILTRILAHRLLKLDSYDRFIGLKFPAYAVPHPNKVMWLIHQFRQVYDYWGTPYQPFPSTPENDAVREAVIRSDTAYITEASRIYTISDNVSKRLKKHNTIESTVLYPPLPDDFRCTPEEYGDVIYFPGRIADSKRQHLAVESMKYTKTPVQLVITGRPDNQAAHDRLQKYILQGNLRSKVKLVTNWISEQEKCTYYAHCLGVIYPPVDEDAYGYVTLESYHSKKPVITCTDSGDTHILVKHTDTGFVSEPDPKEIASYMDKLYEDKKHAQEMGENGYTQIQKLNISWDYVVSTLTS